MLKYLRISNYALIKHVEIDFNKGFSAISGSTGSGKSIMLNAIELLVGGRFDK
jgi:DNA repair protein RecN (Recombination protein N)